MASEPQEEAGELSRREVIEDGDSADLEALVCALRVRGLPISAARNFLMDPRVEELAAGLFPDL